MIKDVKLDNNAAKESVLVHSLSHDGRGIAHIQNKTTFISGALPSENVHYLITKKHKTFNEARIENFLNAAPNRTTPPCEHFNICGGCSLQHMNMDTQIAIKQQTLLDQLRHFGKVTPHEILAPLNAKTEGYRRKARLGVKFVIKKNKVLVGFREKSSPYLADLNQCEVLHPTVGKRLNALSLLIEGLSIRQQIPQIEVAAADAETALVFRHLVDIPQDDLAKLIAFGQENNFHIYLHPNKAKVHQIWPPHTQERLTYSLPQYQLNYLFHPLDFTQINWEMNQLMINQAISLLEINKEDHVLDLFCGIGNFSLPLSRYANFVTGIEGEEEMVKRAQENARYNAINNTQFYAANLFKPNASSDWMKTQYQKILLDPPRAGAKEILPYLSQLGAEKIVYVSCNPATLARDAGELVHQHGYRLNKAGIMNMFPHTSHIEAIALFEKI